MNNHLRQYYLIEIGIQNWQLKSTLDTDFNELDYEPLEEKKPLVISHESLVEDQEPSAGDQEPSAGDQEPSAGDQRPSAGDQEPSTEVQKQSAEKKPLIVRLETAASPQVQAVVENISVSKIPVVSSFDVELVKNIETCNSCPVRKNRLKPLVGEGSSNASVFFISDAPSAAEESEGHYLTGDMQILFNAMLHAIEVENDYFLTGIIKCYSLEEYLITEDEINNCRSHLIAQLEQIKPKVIVALGPVQAKAILNSNKSFNQLRNKVHSININSNPTSSLSAPHSYPVIVSYHPSFLLRNPLYKKEALKDLLLMKDLLAGES